MDLDLVQGTPLLSSPRNLSQLGNRALSKHGFTINMVSKKKTSKAKGGAKSGEWEVLAVVSTEPAPADPKAANAVFQTHGVVAGIRWQRCPVAGIGLLEHVGHQGGVAHAHGVWPQVRHRAKR